MKKLFLLSILYYFQLPTASCQLPYWQQQVDFNIDVTLNDKDNTLDGFVKMNYYNNSPDTLHFIWFHLWPNAYKNDRTAFSDQLLENGRTDFYFSDADKRGYINRLDFKVNGMVARMEDHPLYQDIVKIVLPQPLAPKSSAKIQTPFHVQLPYNFSRGGHTGQSYQVTQWFPKPAVYDRKGWHPMPYLDQGEFYSEFGNFEVQITLPQNYVVAATGELQNESEKKWLMERTDEKWGKEFRKLHSGKKTTSMLLANPNGHFGNTNNASKDTISKYNPASESTFKTLQYRQNNVHDFAWFADKRFVVEKDTLKLMSGRVINSFAYFLPYHNEYWENSCLSVKRTIAFRSKLLGEYPYQDVSIADIDVDYSGGMEYPTIAAISGVKTARELEDLIEHEVGHNWIYGILANNEREHPWMDEGINTFYDNRYDNGESYTRKKEISEPGFFAKRIPKDFTSVAFKTMAAGKKDQPVETASENFSDANYQLVPYYKASQWMKLLENKLGTAMFDSCMHEYYLRWKFKHPYPEDLKKTMEDVSGRTLDTVFVLLEKNGNLPVVPVKKDLRVASFFNLKESDKHHYIYTAPLAGFNFYDKIMLGAIIHNYTLPAEKFQFLVAPLYATGSKQWNGLGRMVYSWFPGNKGLKAELSLAGASFSGDSFTDSANNTKYQRFSKLVPSLKIIFANKDPRSHLLKYLQWKTFLIREQGLLFTRDTINNEDIISYPFNSRYVNRLRFVVDNNRVLYPYRGVLQLEQGKGFARLAFTGNYYFNYAKEGGMNVRIFAGKFFYLGDKTYGKQFETDRYHLNMTGPKGDEDYTYSDYFIGRNEFEKYPSQQIMQRDGFFKVRTDLLSSKIGKTDNWLSAANFTTDIPKKINPLQVLPRQILLKVFVDIGTYAEAWQNNAATGKVLYDAGLQLSLFSNTINIYIPVLYSKVYRDYFKSTITDNRFLKNISFSIDIQNINLRKLAPQIPSY